MIIKSLTIYCSSSNNLDIEFYDLAKNLGKFMAKKSIKVIYGGGSIGLMGELSKSAYSSGGEVIGIIPDFLVNKEIQNNQITETIVVKNMHDRKKKLFELGDGFLILPGGSGTVEEATEVISWKFLGLHDKNIIIFNFNEYWNEFINIYDKAKERNFSNKNLQDICKTVSTFQEFKLLFGSRIGEMSANNLAFVL